MNKRQKIVQEQFLNNEEAIIRKLKNLYSHAEKEIAQKAQALQDDINRLGALADLAEDDEEKAKILSMQQSKVYQKQYQDAMKKQIGSVLDQMQVDEFKTISDYLNQCYEEGFLGTMYDLQGQGIPLCFPMDQEAIVRAVQIDSKISQGLYSRLGEDVSTLKKKITAQVSRGISTGMSYQQIAQQLSGISKIGYNNAVRIARTEGHRIATQSAMDACYKAKDHGADIVKQWDATLDSSTRESHSQVDMEIRELDKPFSNGLMFPGDPRGGAAEVVNCRCSLDQRARWELEGEFTKWDGFTGELKTFESQEAYDEYKKAYFSKENKQYMKYVEEMQGKYNSGNFEKVMAQMTDAEYKHFTKLQAARPTFEGMYRNQPYVKKIKATDYAEFKREYMGRFKSSGKVGDTDGYTTIDDVIPFDFSNKKKVKEEIDKFLESYADSAVEHSIIISPNGNMYKLTGTEGIVNPEIIGKDALIGSIGAHNHPVWEGFDSGDSFSLEDVTFAVEHKTGIEYLTTGNKKYSFEYNGSLNADEVAKEYKKARNDAMAIAFESDFVLEFAQEETMRILAKRLDGFEFHENL